MRFGSRDSSPYAAVVSKPTHDQKAKNRPIAALPAAMPSRPEPAALGQRLERVDRVDRLGHEAVGTAAGEQHGERQRAEQEDLGDQGHAEDDARRC